MKTGIELISAERTRQISQEGWSPEHDDGHKRMEISQAAGAYTKAARLLVLDESSVNEIVNTRPIDWPWGLQSWKPSQDPIRNLVKAGALIAAEIDRLQIALIAKQKLDTEAAQLKCGNWTKCPNAKCLRETIVDEKWACEVCKESWTVDYDEIR